METSGHGHIAGLDGLRGLAVAVVVVFHFWPGLLPGGFVGVSMFFALSGYLITSTVLRERERTHAFSPRAFYARRIRRLLPASLFTVAGVVVFWRAAGWFTVDLAHDSVAAVAQVANWAQLRGGHAYGQDTESSPLLHFWSLAIEEQFYWVFPLLAAAFVSRRRLGAVLWLLFAGTVMVTAWNAGDTVAVYYSTFTRAGEILAGALAAIALHHRRVPVRLAGAASAVGALGVVLLVVVSRLTSLDTTAYGRGGLLAVGIGSALTVAAVAQSGLVARVLDVAPLAWLGVRSYGVYLFHWPVVVALRQFHVGAAGVVAVPATLVLTIVSFRFLEMPVRQRHLFARRPAFAAGLGIMGVLAAAVAVPAAGVSPSSIDFLQAQQRVLAGAPVTTSTVADEEVTTTAVAASAAAVSTTTVPAPVRFAIFGDSKALTLWLGQGVNAGLEFADGWVDLGCPVGRTGRGRVSAREGKGTDISVKCDWTQRFPAALAKSGPVDVGLVYFGSSDVYERYVPALGGWRSMDDADYRAWLYQEMLAATDSLHSNGARVVAWATVYPNPLHGHLDRFAQYNAMLSQLAIDRPGVARVVDLAGWFAAQPDVSQLLPDSVHTSYEPDGGTTRQVFQRFLAAELLRLGRG